MPQLVWIAHHVQRANEVTLDLERRSLDQSFGSVHDYTGQSINGRKAHREFVAPPFARDVTQELGHAISTLEHVLRRRHLATAVRHDAHVCRKELRQQLEIS